ncbi:plastid division protein PDV1-like [Hordeum vulgare]|nr:plastid division protein PDV1-like [Hordeum vulgare]
MRWNWETPTTEAKAEALQERIWDLHDKLSHAILALSACAGLPACRCRGAPMADARGLHTIRAALEDLEGHLHFLRVSASPPSPPLILPTVPS